MQRTLLAGLAVSFLLFLSLPAQDGRKAPDFTLPAADGTSVTLSALRGKNVVLVFYRGYW